MRPIYRDVVLLCPELPTGGPEAMHQLAFEINHLGGRAQLAYYGARSALDFAGDWLRGQVVDSPMPAYFAHYAPQVFSEIQLTPEILIVYPEVMASIALQPLTGDPYRALWWLSVDNAITREPRLQDVNWRRDNLAAQGLRHFTQSAYARRFLAAADVPNLPLSDYTDPLLVRRSLSEAVPLAQRAPVICFFPTKGAALARAFIAQNALRQPAQFTPIHQMTKAQVADTLFGAQIYLDFGHHPGKDRVPREAALAGCIVLLHAQGAALEPGDHPLDAAYRFTADDVASGDLQRRVDAILADPVPHVAAQAPYRAAIMRERETFTAEVQAAFFTEAA